MKDLAVLLMAYGAPSSEDEIEAYLTDIGGGQKPNPNMVHRLRERYRKIGGKSPLLDITAAQASALGRALKSQGVDAPVYFAMRHWHPYAKEVVPRILDSYCHKILALALTPHYSEISTGGYKQALERSLEGMHEVEIDFVDSWYDNPIFHQAVAEKITSAPKQSQGTPKAQIIFTAHSLPERILQCNDPYPKQLEVSCQAVGDLLKINDWLFAYQSAGHTTEKWLGPSILEVLEKLSIGTGRRRDILIVPIGFVADHLEILYDIDVEAREFAKNHGLNLMRTESLNTSPTFVSALADVIKRRVCGS